MRNIQRVVTTAKNRFQIILILTKQRINVIRHVINRNPLRSFFGLLIILLGLVLFTNWLGQPPAPAESSPVEPKKVNTYRIGTTPKVRFSGKIEKSGVITIVSQGSGIIATLDVKEGQLVQQGARLVSLSSNYQGGNTASLQRQIAETSFQFAKANFPLQEEVVAKRREVAEKTDTSADELRKITNDSIQTTKDAINTSKHMLSLINEQLESQPDDTILLQQKIGLLNGINAAEQGLKNAEYAVNDDHAPAQLTNLGKDITLKQLDLEERSILLNLEIARLNFLLTQAAEATMFPVAPFVGTVERIQVNVGQMVSPGTPLITFSGRQQSASIEVLVPQDIADGINRAEPSILSFGHQQIETTPYHVSSEPTNGRLFSVLYTLPEAFVRTPTFEETSNQKGAPALIAATHVTNGQLISVDIPVGSAQSSTSMPFVPLDAVYQTEQDAAIYAVVDGIAQSRTVTLGQVYGSYVQVLSGITGDTDVIVDRSVVAGEKVELQR
ncbi:hypothetical protein HY468_04350 [Candidatus Roizmanbacteria bacterium]|nr:hypothetical protein [Candidatus Roizmanbacteria bacterium]